MSIQRLSAHQLAKRLLEMPDYLVHFDGMGKDIGLSSGEFLKNPGLGQIYPKSGSSPMSVIVIELEEDYNTI